MRMRRVIAGAMTLVLLGSTAAQADDLLIWGWGHRPVLTPFTSPMGYSACHVEGSAWTKEVGASGVNQLKAKFSLYSGGTSEWLGWSQTDTGWLYTGTFADDGGSHWWTFTGRLSVFGGGSYIMGAKFVGLRPGFWRTDRITYAELGPADCDAVIDVEVPGS